MFSVNHVMLFFFFPSKVKKEVFQGLILNPCAPYWTKYTQTCISHLCTASVLFWSVNRILIESCNHRELRLERRSGALQSNLLLTAEPFLRSSLVFQGLKTSRVGNYTVSFPPPLQGEEVSPYIQPEHLFQLRPILPLPPTMHTCERPDSISSVTSLLSLCGGC